MSKKLKIKRPAKPPIRLVWAEAGSVTANPANWRTHPEKQTNAISAAISDPDIGWAGVLLYNEQTGRLIDGHGRLEIVQPADVVPLLVGSWSEEAERKILLTFDTISKMAEVDHDALANLLETTTFEDEDLSAIADNLRSLLESADEDPDEEHEAEIPEIYQVIVDCENEVDQAAVYATLSKLKKLPGKLKCVSV